MHVGRECRKKGKGLKTSPRESQHVEVRWRTASKGLSEVAGTEAAGKPRDHGGRAVKKGMSHHEVFHNFRVQCQQV